LYVEHPVETAGKAAAEWQDVMHRFASALAKREPIHGRGGDSG